MRRFKAFPKFLIFLLPLLIVLSSPPAWPQEPTPGEEPVIEETPANGEEEEPPTDEVVPTAVPEDISGIYEARRIIGLSLLDIVLEITDNGDGTLSGSITATSPGGDVVASGSLEGTKEDSAVAIFAAELSIAGLGETIEFSDAGEILPSGALLFDFLGELRRRPPPGLNGTFDGTSIIGLSLLDISLELQQDEEGNLTGFVRAFDTAGNEVARGEISGSVADGEVTIGGDIEIVAAGETIPFVDRGLASASGTEVDFDILGRLRLAAAEEEEIVEVRFERTISAVDAEAGTLTTDRDETIRLLEETELVDEDDNPISLEDLQEGQSIEVIGFREEDGTITASRIELLTEEEAAEATSTVEGRIERLRRAEDGFTIIVADQELTLTSDSEIVFSDGEPAAIGDLSTGLFVRATFDSDGIVLLLEIETEQAEPEGAEIEGGVLVGPFERTSGPPNRFVVNFEAEENSGIIIIRNRGVTSAEVFLNGREIASPAVFNTGIERIRIPVRLRELNRLELELRGAPGTSMDIILPGEAVPDGEGEILGEDEDGDRIPEED